MPTGPRAVVSIELAGTIAARTVVITVPTAIDRLDAGTRAPDGVGGRILAAMADTLEKLGVVLDDGAIVVVERIEEQIAWCRIDTTV